MKIMILGDNRVFECLPGVTLGKIMDDLNDSLKQNKRIIRRIFLDEEELNLEMLQEKAKTDVEEFENLTIESATFADAAFEMLKRINLTIPNFNEHLINTIESLKRFSPNAVQMFSDFSDASGSIFESIDNSLLLLEIDAKDVLIGDISLRKILDELFTLYNALRDLLEEDAFKDEDNLIKIIGILELKIAPKIAKIPEFLNTIIETEPPQES